MKRGTPGHPKTTHLMAELKLPRFAAVGLLEMLWHFTAHYAQAGDIGRHSDEAIAHALGWEGDAAVLSAALRTARWVDPCACHRLRVHDWPDHADQQAARAAARIGGFLSCYLDKPPELAAVAQPLPEPLPGLAKPEPSPPREAANGALLAEYVQEIQAAFMRKTGRPETQGLASTEYAIARRWFDEGVPLRVVLTAIKETKGEGRRLMYYAASVEDEVKRWRKAIA